MRFCVVFASLFLRVGLAEMCAGSLDLTEGVMHEFTIAWWMVEG